ncbi:DUF4132 domain-containing protein [Corynebacterium felinum]|uniref:DUF4132 domain-containing protein n=1 Tax=Corynebacterium felinum TaxID=131318 RepID=A0ABU2BB58_9CORY|nr:DUF4132 domain-containing protein [Corynebacterium felinum]MDF5820699.1 DUF4132 domain-containing protein [Corynebacterium felinum]MDR7355526.1 hypothetical protein [Corynebacterium felinum]WJY94876.1 hypothetical protein CFELI_06280 [Corynebacterium felinum]
MTDSADGWIPAGDYFLKVEDGQIKARNAKGRVLKSVPAKAKKTPAFDRLAGLLTVLTQHDQECAQNVAEWFLHGHPIPVIAIQQLWPDPIWRKYLHNLVITDGTVVGLLRDIRHTGVAVADLDGESVEITAETITIPHPAVLCDIEDWREFSSELGATQGIDQLFREIHHKPADAQTQREHVQRYKDAHFEQASHLFSRARNGGFKADMYGATVEVNEAGQRINALLELEAYDPFSEAHLGVLKFFSANTEIHTHTMLGLLPGVKESACANTFMQVEK